MITNFWLNPSRDLHDMVYDFLAQILFSCVRVHPGERVYRDPPYQGQKSNVVSHVIAEAKASALARRSSFLSGCRNTLPRKHPTGLLYSAICYFLKSFLRTFGHKYLGTGAVLFSNRFVHANTSKNWSHIFSTSRVLSMLKMTEYRQNE